MTIEAKNFEMEIDGLSLWIRIGKYFVYILKPSEDLDSRGFVEMLIPKRIKKEH